MPSVKRSRPATATGETDTGDSEDETAALPQTLTEAQVGILTDKVNRCLRWNSFLTHCYINGHDIIDSVTKGTLDHESGEFRTLRQKTQESTRQWKFKTLKNIEVSLLPNV
jgi:hypothetical protein